jgi:hypothetical protein
MQVKSVLPGLLSLIIFLVGAGAAEAQPSSDRDLGTDIRPRIIPSAPGEEDARPLRDFEIALTAPILFTTNALRESAVEAGLPPSQKRDWHFTPDLLGRWSHQFSWFKASISLDASVDRFFTQTAQDEDSVFGNVKLALTDGRSDVFVPYIAYAATADFRPNFRTRDDTLHDFAAGLSSAIAYTADWKPIRARDAIDPGNVSIAADLSAGRRLADPSLFENTFVVAAMDLLYVATNDVALGLTPKVRVRWYDNFGGRFRRDYQLSADLRAVWTPDWLTQLVRRGEFDFTVTFRRRLSNLSGESFTEWEFGPAAVFAWRF